jgi:hypothetical protein
MIDDLIAQREAMKQSATPVTLKVITEDAAKIQTLSTSCPHVESNIDVKVISPADKVLIENPESVEAAPEYVPVEAPVEFDSTPDLTGQPVSI